VSSVTITLYMHPLHCIEGNRALTLPGVIPNRKKLFDWRTQTVIVYLGVPGTLLAQVMVTFVPYSIEHVVLKLATIALRAACCAAVISQLPDESFIETVTAIITGSVAVRIATSFVARSFIIFLSMTVPPILKPIPCEPRAPR
jgi:hypothetical protein